MEISAKGIKDTIEFDSDSNEKPSNKDEKKENKELDKKDTSWRDI